MLIVLQKVSYMAERVVGTGSFGVVFQVYYFTFCHSVLLLLVMMEIYNIWA